MPRYELLQMSSSINNYGCNEAQLSSWRVETTEAMNEQKTVQKVCSDPARAANTYQAACTGRGMALQFQSSIPGPRQ
jgi:hypothetical protein